MTAPLQTDAAEPVRRRRALFPVAVAVASMIVAAVLLTAGFLFKARCLGPTFDVNGVSGPDLGPRSMVEVCYSDLQTLWANRHLYSHLPPYSGSYTHDGGLTGGTLEYPVLSGLLLWLFARPASTDAQFFQYTAAGLALAGLLTAYLLARLTGWRSLWWSLAPGLVLYTALNVDHLPVAATVAAFAIVLSADALDPGSRQRRRRLLLAAGMLSVGAGLKLYPLLFVVPVALWIGIGDRRNESVVKRRSPDWPGAAMFAGVAAAGFALMNVPFAVANFDGWWAAFQFQWQRPIDATTNSIWYWSLRPFSDSHNIPAQRMMATVSTAATALSLLAVCLAGLRRRTPNGYPWLQVCAAMLCAYLLFNKVHSPQYVLWLIPFFVLLRVPWRWIAAYYVADACMGIGFFRRVASGTNSIEASIWPQVVVVGVWGRAVLLVILIVIFLRADSTVRNPPDRAMGSTPDRAMGSTPDRAMGSTPDRAMGSTPDRAMGSTDRLVGGAHTPS